MSEAKSEGKLQQLIEKFGGWAAIALVTLACFTYQGDRANTQSQIIAIETNLKTTNRAISRLQEGKVSKEELKNVQESWIRETAGLRQDIRDFMKMQQRE
jgi:hypothetical protein